MWWLYDAYEGVRVMMKDASPDVSLDWDHTTAYVHRLVHFIKTFEITKENAIFSAYFFHLQMVWTIGNNRHDILKFVFQYPFSIKLVKKSTDPTPAALYLPPSYNLL